MATTGHFVRERIPVARTVPETARLVLELVSNSRDTTAESAGPMTFRLLRRYRPTWATATGFLIFPLFVRNSEVCRLAVIDAASGAEVLLEGTLDTDLHERLIHLGRAPEAARVSTLGPRPVPPVLSSQSSSAAPSAAAAAPAAPAPNHSIDLRGRGAGWDDEFSPTLLPRAGESNPAGNGARPAAAEWPAFAPPPASAPPVAPAFAPGMGVGMAPAAGPAPVHLSLDSGEQADLRQLLIIGRAPSRDAHEPHADLLTVNDPSLSVSKSHLTVELDQQGLWVTDRGSTNGSWLDEGRGALRPVPPQQRTLVPPGARVLIGERVISFIRR